MGTNTDPSIPRTVPANPVVGYQPTYHDIDAQSILELEHLFNEQARVTFVTGDEPEHFDHQPDVDSERQLYTPPPPVHQMSAQIAPIVPAHDRYNHPVVSLSYPPPSPNPEEASPPRTFFLHKIPLIITLWMTTPK